MNNLWLRRRIMSGLLLFGLLLPLLAACGGAAEPATSSVIANASPTVSAPTASSTVASPAASASTAASASAATTDATAAPSDVAATPSEAANASPTASAPETQTPVEGNNSNIPTTLEYGAVAQLYYTDADRVVTLAGIAGFDWVRQQVPWKDTALPDGTFGFQELDKVVESVAKQNKKLLLSVVKSPEWATGRAGDYGLPRDNADYGRFVEELAKRYKGKVHAIEVWNEQNLAFENGGRVVPEDAGRYVELLKEGYTRIKAVDPGIAVIAGALSSSGENNPERAVDDITYYKAMYTYNNGEIKNYMDAQGFHPASTLNPPDALYPEAPGPGCELPDKPWCEDRTHYFRHIEDVRQVMVDTGLDDKQIWITEMGWATENTTPGYEYGNSISMDQQAEYLEGALYRILSQYDYVGVAFIWNLNFAVTWGQAGDPLHEQASFGLLNPDYSPRPSFSRIQGFINARRQSGQ